MIQVIIRAIDILEFVALHGKQPVQLIKIAEQVQLSQPTTANIVKTLMEKGYLEQVSRKEGYRLGFASYRLTGNASYDQDLIAASKEPMENLARQLNETTLLAQIRNNKRVILNIVESDQPLQVKTVMVANLYDTSSGRLLMAYLSPKELETLIKAIGYPQKKTWPGAQTMEGLKSQLQIITKNEFVQTLSIYHTVGFAVPVYKNSQVVAALSVFVPQSRYTDSHKEKIYKLIRSAAKKIRERLE
ncbi:MAG: IclR family transcriptional regulator [Bacteroidota bacterium]|nr:IclR family transcriptional regulator [Bacteroidota bacterium]